VDGRVEREMNIDEWQWGRGMPIDTHQYEWMPCVCQFDSTEKGFSVTLAVGIDVQALRQGPIFLHIFSSSSFSSSFC